jgi:hypothetical protein
MHVCVYLCMYVYIYTYKRINVCMYMCTNIRIYFIYMYACMYVCTCIPIYVCSELRKHAQLYVRSKFLEGPKTPSKYQQEQQNARRNDKAGVSHESCV